MVLYVVINNTMLISRRVFQAAETKSEPVGQKHDDQQVPGGPTSESSPSHLLLNTVRTTGKPAV